MEIFDLIHELQEYFNIKKKNLSKYLHTDIEQNEEVETHSSIRTLYCFHIEF